MHLDLVTLKENFQVCEYFRHMMRVCNSVTGALIMMISSAYATELTDELPMHTPTFDLYKAMWY